MLPISGEPYVGIIAAAHSASALIPAEAVGGTIAAELLKSGGAGVRIRYTL